MIHVENVSKTFVLHQQNGVRLPVLQNASLEVSNGECVVLHGHSGSGKSTLLRSCTPIICRTKAISISAITMNGLIWSGSRAQSAGSTPLDDRLGQPVPAGDPADLRPDVVMQPLLDPACRAKPAPLKPPAC